MQAHQVWTFSREQCMAEYPPLFRQWILLRMLCARRFGATLKDLAQEMGVSEKTIKRDLDTFQSVGFPVREVVEERGRKKWHIELDKNTPGMTFACDEAIALYLGRRFLEPLAGTIFWEAAQRAFKKIRATLGDSTLKYIEKFAPLFHKTMVGVSDYSQKAELIDQLMLGIEDHRAVFITYQSLQATEPVTYDIYPYGLAYHRGSLYLIGRKVEGRKAKEKGRGKGLKTSEKDCISHWKVDRITEAEVTRVPFQPPEDFDLAKHLSTSFGIFHGGGEVTVKVRFSPTVARYVQEAAWHPSQKLTPQRDGGLLAEFQLDGTEEIKRWILSFGRHAEVVKPEALSKEILVEAMEMSRNYSPNRKRSDQRPSSAIQE
jgi:predicted DNA-binding transcriptional regulator YafY